MLQLCKVGILEDGAAETHHLHLNTFLPFESDASFNMTPVTNLTNWRNLQQQKNLLFKSNFATDVINAFISMSPATNFTNWRNLQQISTF